LIEKGEKTKDKRLNELKRVELFQKKGQKIKKGWVRSKFKRNAARGKKYIYLYQI
jgi:hypothetical protein